MRKNSLIRIFSLLLAVLLTAGLAVPANAESEVVFKNGKVIAFAPGSVWTDSDLFGNFKGVMPGDVREEVVKIKNEVTDSDYIKVYMRAVPHDEMVNKMSAKVAAEEPDVALMNDFLAQLKLQVMNGQTKIYEDTPNLAGGLKDNVLLGTLRKGQELSLNIKLEVPLDLGNEYMDRVGEVDWVFVVEGLDDPVPPTPKKPDKLIQTGQLKWPIPILGGLGLLLVAYGLLLTKKRKREDAK